MPHRGNDSLPDFLRLDRNALVAMSHSVCVIDAAGEILWTNPAWHAFAAENGAGEASHTWTSYLSPIPEPLRAFYEEAFREALTSGNVFEHDYDCSTPEANRRYRLFALPIDGRALVLEHSLVSSLAHPVDDAAELEAHYVDPQGVVTQCAHCRRVKHPRSGAFHWVPAWVQRPHPRTSHALCASCTGFYYGPHRRRSRRRPK